MHVWARVRVAATMTRVVALETLAPGETIKAEQVRVETYDDFPLHSEVARDLEEVVGRLPRRAIRAGLPVFRTDLTEPLQVQRGDLVRVIAVSGAAQMELEAVAESSGRKGETISLRNPGSGKTVSSAHRRERLGRVYLLQHSTASEDAMKVLGSVMICARDLQGAALAKNKKKAPPELSPLDKYVNDAHRQNASPEAAHSAGSIWSPNARFANLGTDLKASHVNDLVTIVVNEKPRRLPPAT